MGTTSQPPTAPSLPGLPPPLQLLVLILVGWVSRQQQDVIAYLRAENDVLREQLDRARGGKRLRFTEKQRRRLAVAGQPLGRKLLRELAGIVTPDTILRWYRQLVAKKYDGSAKKQKKAPGRPRLAETITQLVVRLATENPRAGYTKIRDMARGLNRQVGRSTVQRILQAHGIEPAPERGKKTTWKQFLDAHLDALAAIDFFSVEVLTLKGLVRYQVLFVIELATRRVHLAGIGHDGQWTQQRMRLVARALTDFEDGFLRATRYLIMDRDPLFGAGFRQALQDGGVQAKPLPARSPNLNAYAERFVLSIKSECLRHVIPLGEAHLRHLVREYLAHYHGERFHQGLGSRLVEPDPKAANASGRTVCRKRLGGLLRFYYRAVA